MFLYYTASEALHFNMRKLTQNFSSLSRFF